MGLTGDTMLETFLQARLQEAQKVQVETEALQAELQRLQRQEKDADKLRERIGSRVASLKEKAHGLELLQAEKKHMEEKVSSCTCSTLLKATMLLGLEQLPASRLKPDPFWLLLDTSDLINFACWCQWLPFTCLLLSSRSADAWSTRVGSYHARYERFLNAYACAVYRWRL